MKKSPINSSDELLPDASLANDGCFSVPQHAALKKLCGKKDGKKNTRKLRPGYQSWANMKTRCCNENNAAYPNYGGRGITYDPAWEEFETFIADMGDPPGPHHSLDRINPDGNYEKENCRWVSKKVQTRNRRITVKVSYRGEERILAELADDAEPRPGSKGLFEDRPRSDDEVRSSKLPLKKKPYVR